MVTAIGWLGDCKPRTIEFASRVTSTVIEIPAFVDTLLLERRAEDSVEVGP